ncbi:MAG: Brp/Blh family beta-carotene 15,15'-dioxygenase [Planctomycetota bacterium]|nr:Brp/Blh family beta-carotene 15,15'-dioxygenase [Planctomycetota bacterium]
MATAIALATLVAVVGLPHGAADHRFARPRLEPLLGETWLPVFLAGYVAIAGLVVWGWFAAPAFTIVAFFAASAWHFGQEDPHLSIGPRPLRPLFRFARGGLVIWASLAFHGAEVVRILSVASPRGFGPEVERAVAVLTPCGWALLAVATAGWLLEGLTALAASGRKRRVLLADTAVVASLAVLFAVTSPLVGFLVYFCGWHSARGLKRLRVELGETWLQLARSLAPMTIGAIALIAVVAVAVLRGPTWNDTLIRATFVGLSSVAAPHLLLHGIAGVIGDWSGRGVTRTVQAGSPA